MNPPETGHYGWGEQTIHQLPGETGKQAMARTMNQENVRQRHAHLLARFVLTLESHREAFGKRFPEK
jgi:hypothetical protein